jgi:hypothetical protein
MIFNAMRDSGIPVERKNSAVSSHRQGSNNTGIMNEKKKSRGDGSEMSETEKRVQDKNRDFWHREKGRDENSDEDCVKEEWIEDVVYHGRNGGTGKGGFGQQETGELAASEIGVAL